MKKFSVKIKNLFGLEEYEIDGANKILTGSNGTGKSSNIDSIRYALQNRTDRDFTIKKGAEEGEVLFEIGDLRIDRKKRNNKADYSKIENAGNKLNETALRMLFHELQLNPAKFCEMDAKEMNRQILDVILAEYHWNLDTIKGWFGEIVPEVEYDQNLLQVLHAIQSEKGYYFRTRQDINRKAYHNKTHITEIGETLPENYRASNWENIDLSERYGKIKEIEIRNTRIRQAKNIVENADNKKRAFEAELEISINTIDKQISTRRSSIDSDIARLEEQLKALKAEKKTLEEKRQTQIDAEKANHKAKIAEFEAQVKEYQEDAKREVESTDELREEAEYAEKMKKHINEYNRMVGLIRDNEQLVKDSAEYTRKIELARELPGQILEECEMPIDNLTVEDGMPLINGLPVSNLSDGEKYELCIHIAARKNAEIKFMLLDGLEKLSSQNRQKIFELCKKLGVQFIGAMTTDSDVLEITEV